MKSSILDLSILGVILQSKRENQQRESTHIVSPPGYNFSV